MNKNIRPCTIDYLNEVFSLNEDGSLTLKVKLGKGPRCQAGSIRFGSKTSDGYLSINVLGSKCLMHRVIVAIRDGVWPPYDVDHINGVTSDNRPANLRAASRKMNQENRRVPSKASKTGYLGVFLEKGKYKAAIRHNNKKIALGTFLSAEEASAAYLAKKREIHEGATL